MHRLSPPSPTDPSLTRLGYVYGLSAFAMWGLIPIYFKAVDEVPPVEVLAHRILWSVVVLAAVVAWQGKWAEALAAVRSWPTLRVLLLSTVLIAVNWFVFIWAVDTDRVLEASLGYFINPLVNVLLGFLFLRERLSRPVLIAVSLAVAGVTIQLVLVGSLPLISLILAFSFGFYGLLRKTAPVGATVGLLVETSLLAPAALAFMLWAGNRNEGHFATGSISMDALLVAAGIVTAVPLLLFTRATRLLPLSTIGFLQYVGPTGQFLLATIAFGEALTVPRIITFVLIWAALILFTWDQVHRERRRLV